MMPFYVYIILCAGGSFYTGYTKNIDRRLKLHLAGRGARYTRINKPERVVYIELFDSRAKAMKREREIKRMTHKQKRDLINSQNGVADRAEVGLY
ncbi:MAG: GIY-YIG nuclease family protein [Candidatus Bathyarchaeota archaeon]|nr:GIY-YIG nuclease family protein [Candidatus Bathyarchaeota archaeon]